MRDLERINGDDYKNKIRKIFNNHPVITDIIFERLDVFNEEKLEILSNLTFLDFIYSYLYPDYYSSIEYTQNEYSKYIFNVIAAVAKNNEIIIYLDIYAKSDDLPKQFDDTVDVCIITDYDIWVERVHSLVLSLEDNDMLGLYFNNAVKLGDRI